MLADSATPYDQYRTVQVQTAPPTTLVVMLYDGAIRFLGSARRHLNARRLDAASNDLIRAQDIIKELQVSLNLEAGGELARNLYQLYDFMLAELVRTNLAKDPGYLDPLLRMLSELREAWAEIAARAAVTATAK